MSNKLTTPAHLIESLLAAARYHKIDLEAVFKGADLNFELYTSDLTNAKDPRIKLTHIGPLLRSLWSMLEDEASGFLSRPFKIGTFSMMCHAIISSGNLRRALLRSGKFIHLLSDEVKLELIESGDEAQLAIDYKNPHKLDEVFFVTSLFVIWIRLSCWLIQKPILLNRIEFTFDEPEYSDEYAQMFPCRHVFSSERNLVVFDRKNLALEIQQDPSELSSFLLNAPESLLTQFRSDDSLTAQVKRLLLKQREGVDELANLTFEEVSDVLCTTTHTLRRRLKDEGNSFQEIKDSIRKDYAIDMLSNSDFSVLELSNRLGFSEPAAFNRAFKKWTGKTPGSFKGK